MVGPIVTQVPFIGPLRADAPKEADERRIQEQVSRKVPKSGAPSDSAQPSDEVLTAEGEINKLAQGVLSTNSRLSIEEDKETGDYIYRVIDTETGDVINQWPREELLRHARVADETIGGVIDQRV